MHVSENRNDLKSISFHLRKLENVSLCKHEKKKYKIETTEI